VRKSNKEAALTRKAIVAAAADHIRGAGIVEASVADVMTAAGLTHGGFYRHFRNKEQLVAEALSAAGDETVAVFNQRMRKVGVDGAVDGYLSTSHRDAPTPMCPFAALGSEIARADHETKAAASEILKRVFDALAEGTSGPEARSEAISAFCTMVGAMTLSRIASDDSLSDQILMSAKTRLRRQTKRA
jgi:TetR/AcrR family transcriptional repressor of nem operon